MASPLATKPRVVTGNALRSGKSVWLTETGDWSTRMAQACVFLDGVQAEDALTSAQARSGEVVGCYLADVRPTPDGPQPIHFREAFRRDGPSAAARVPTRN